MSRNVEQLARAAGQAANDGKWVEAEDLWRQVLKAAPQHPQALLSLGIHALQRGDLSASCMMLKAARAVAPRDLLTLLTLSSACRLSGDVAAEREAIDAALAVDAYYLPALLARASWQERVGDVESASATYGNALGIAPPPAHWPASLRPQLEHAQAFVERYSKVLHGYLAEQLRDLLAALPADAAGRWREAVSIVAGRTKPYVSRCNQLYVPRLPAIPFYERSEFPGLSQLEAKTDAIRAEFTAAFSGAHDKFNPYIAYRPGDPVNQWQELNHSARWSAYHLWRGGVPVRENLERCPETARALESARMAEIGGLCPNAMFSVLAPKTTIPPHNGETNARVVAHLPLVVPEHCLYRVGFEERRWRVGEVLVFDDSIEHEARNDSDQIRVVLIFDLWNPRISEAERGLIQAITTARRAFSGESAAGSRATE